MISMTCKIKRSQMTRTPTQSPIPPTGLRQPGRHRDDAQAQAQNGRPGRGAGSPSAPERPGEHSAVLCAGLLLHPDESGAGDRGQHFPRRGRSAHHAHPGVRRGGHSAAFAGHRLGHPVRGQLLHGVPDVGALFVRHLKKKCLVFSWKILILVGGLKDNTLRKSCKTVNK
uniref:(northern house mosquito) hypothetical protein n=1 Tax=Culex pipiens TaxID=7175 RepID=A0A8D8D927_CULPI